MSSYLVSYILEIQSQLFPKHSNTRGILLTYFSGKIFPRPFAMKISDGSLFLVFSCHSEILLYQFLRDSIYLHHDDSPVTQIFGFPLYWFSIWRTVSFISFLRKGIGWYMKHIFLVHFTWLFWLSIELCVKYFPTGFWKLFSIVFQLPVLPLRSLSSTFFSLVCLCLLIRFFWNSQKLVYVLISVMSPQMASPTF